MNKRIQKKQFNENLDKEIKLLKFELSLPKARLGHKLIKKNHGEKIYYDYDKKTGQSFGKQYVFSITKYK